MTVPRKKLRVLFVEASSGLGGSTRALAEMLRGIDGERFDKTAFFTRPDAATERIDAGGTRVIKSARALAAKPWRWIPDALYVRRVLAQTRPDVVHINDDIYSAVAVILAAWTAGVPIVCHLRSERRPTRVEKLVAPLCRRLIAICASGREYYGRHLPGMGKRIELISDSFTKVEPRQAGQTTRRMTIGMMSNLIRGKGQEHMIGAMPRILEWFPEARLILAGKDMSNDGYVRELKAQAENLKVSRAVEFVGWVDNVSEFLSGIDIFVDSSYLHEGFRHTVVEAMQGGVPTIATDVGAVREIITSGADGIVVPPGESAAIAEAACALLRDPAMMAEIGRNARRTAEDRCGRDDGVRRMENLYVESAAQSRRA